MKRIYWLAGCRPKTGQKIQWIMEIITTIVFIIFNIQSIHIPWPWLCSESILQETMFCIGEAARSYFEKQSVRSRWFRWLLLCKVVVLVRCRAPNLIYAWSFFFSSGFAVGFVRNLAYWKLFDCQILCIWFVTGMLAGKPNSVWKFNSRIVGGYEANKITKLLKTIIKVDYEW